MADDLSLTSSDVIPKPRRWHPRFARSASYGNGICSWAGYCLFFLMLFVPTRYQHVKAALLFFVLAAVFGRVLLSQRLRLHPVVAAWTILMVVTGISFMALGYFNGAPGAIRVGTVYVLWPIVFTFLAEAASNIVVIRRLSKLLVIAGAAIGIYALVFLLVSYGAIPEYFYFEIDQGQATGSDFGSQEFKLFSLATLLFLAPFLVAALFSWPREHPHLKARGVVWVALLVSLAAAFLSGRRGLWLVVLLSVPLAVLGRGLLPHRYRPRKYLRVVLSILLVSAILLVYLQSTGVVNAVGIVQKFAASFDMETESARHEQLNALLRGWWKKPLFGSGLGAGVEGSTRSAAMPWAYELSYVSLLYHTGMIGFALYTLPVLWILFTAVRIIRSGGELAFHMAPILVGMVGFLIANATNPYLTKFDFMWVIFLPVAIINFWLLGKPQNRASAKLHRGP